MPSRSHSREVGAGEAGPLESGAAASFTPCRTAPERSAREKSAPSILAVERSAPTRLAPASRASPRSAPWKIARSRIAPSRSAASSRARIEVGLLGAGFGQSGTAQVGAARNWAWNRDAVPEIRRGEMGVRPAGPDRAGRPEVGSAQVGVAEVRVVEDDRPPRRRPPGRPPSGRGAGWPGLQPSPRACRRLAAIGWSVSSGPATRRRRRSTASGLSAIRQGGLARRGREGAGRPATGTRAPREVVRDPVGGQEELDRPMSEQPGEGRPGLVSAEAFHPAERRSPRQDERIQAVALDALAIVRVVQAPIQLDPQRLPRPLDRLVRRHPVEDDRPEFGDSFEQVGLRVPPREPAPSPRRSGRGRPPGGIRSTRPGPRGRASGRRGASGRGCARREDDQAPAGRRRAPSGSGSSRKVTCRWGGTSRARWSRAVDLPDPSGPETRIAPRSWPARIGPISSSRGNDSPPPRRRRRGAGRGAGRGWPRRRPRPRPHPRRRPRAAVGLRPRRSTSASSSQGSQRSRESGLGSGPGLGDAAEAHPSASQAPPSAPATAPSAQAPTPRPDARPTAAATAAPTIAEPAVACSSQGKTSEALRREFNPPESIQRPGEEPEVEATAGGAGFRPRSRISHEGRSSPGPFAIVVAVADPLIPSLAGPGPSGTIARRRIGWIWIGYANRSGRCKRRGRGPQVSTRSKAGNVNCS